MYEAGASYLPEIKIASFLALRGGNEAIPYYQYGRGQAKPLQRSCDIEGDDFLTFVFAFAVEDYFGCACVEVVAVGYGEVNREDEFFGWVACFGVEDLRDGDDYLAGVSLVGD
jgi:hypothetical protein